jgi:hypothetical protein
MPAVDSSEVRAGLVVRLDTTTLRERGGSETNAQMSAGEDRAVTGVHDFLVVNLDPRTDVATAVPLFARTAPGSSPLDPRKREGGSTGWTTEPLFYSHWQHWRIPRDALVRAATADPALVGARRLYATGSPDALQDILNWATRNRNDFRPI